MSQTITLMGLFLLLFFLTVNAAFAYVFFSGLWVEPILHLKMA